MKRALLFALFGLSLLGCDKKPPEQSAVEMSDSESDSAEIARLEAEHPGLFLDPTPDQIAAATPLNNTICPTDGEKNGSMGAPVRVVYKGKVVDLCCGGCPMEFGSDPDHYLALAEANKGPEEK